LNIVNEKIYVFLWFWFIIVAIMSGLALVYRIGVVCSGGVRRHLLRAQARLANAADVDVINEKCMIGDWFVLLLLGKNMEPLIYKEFIGDLAERLQGKTPV